jgi:dTDP-4-dehydrorhamnose reductase
VIWLVGDRGMLGSELSEALNAAGAEFTGSDREVDILDESAISAFAEGKGLEWIVNCAAYTAVERAEAEPELCARLNAEGPAKLARLATRIGAKLLQVSTDYVFDGTGTVPYREDDPIAPLGVYGRTKAEGEAAVRELCAQHVIVRTAWLYGKHGPNFVATMLRLMGERERVGVVADQRGSPTRAGDLARAIVAILRASPPRFGTYHFTNLGETSWQLFALEIYRLWRELGLLRRDCAIEALTTAQYPSKVARPAYSVLSKEKILAVYGLSIPRWEDSLADYLREAAREGVAPGTAKG